MMHGLQVCCVAFNRQPAASALSSFEVRAIFDASRVACPKPFVAGQRCICSRHFVRQIRQHVRLAASLLHLSQHFGAHILTRCFRFFMN